MRYILSLLLSLCLAWSAQAEIVPALNVHTDYFPDREYSLGFDLDAGSLISRIYFQDNTGERTFYTLERLQNFAPIFKIMGFTLVRMRIASVDAPQSATVELQILKNYLTGGRRSIFFQVNFNQKTSKYEITDARSGNIVQAVKVITRYAGPVPVGIYDLSAE